MSILKSFQIQFMNVTIFWKSQLNLHKYIYSLYETSFSTFSDSSMKTRSYNCTHLRLKKNEKNAEGTNTLSNAKVLSICLLAIFCTAETSLLPSLHEITTGVCSLISSSLNGLQKQTNTKPMQSHNIPSCKQAQSTQHRVRPSHNRLTHLQRTRTCTLTPLSLSYLL